MGFNSCLKNINKFRLVLLSIVVGLLVALTIITINNIMLFRNNVTVSLIGNEVDYIAVNTDYFDQGLMVSINDKVINIDEIDHTVTNNIKSNVLGEYEINYAVSVGEEEYNFTRKVNVIDNEKPVITTNQTTLKKYMCSNSNNSNLEYSAIDNYDGVITDKVKVTELTDRVELSVSDASGNKSVISIPIEYGSSPSSKITLNGKSFIYIPLGSTFNDPGATVSDGCGKKLDIVPTVTSDLDVNKEGTYTITYEVDKDKATYGVNKRTVIVYKRVDSQKYESSKDKVVYLTFDDGPGAYTEQLLNILDKYNVKATFFVTNQFGKYVPLIAEENKRGHKVAVHTLTHNWSIYRSVENYVKDFNDMNNIVEKYTGQKADIFRFPGGSSNTVSRNYATGVVSAIASYMNSQGYTYFDWNVDSEDAAGANTQQIIHNVTTRISNRSYSVVLMHDIKLSTLNAIEEIIKYGIDNGYTFEVLSSDSPTVHHSINN